MERSIIAAVALLCLGGTAYAQSYGTGANPYEHYTNGYTRSNGTYVQPHYQTNPNSSTLDNYGTRGNYNPHMGTYGTRNPY